MNPILELNTKNRLCGVKLLNLIQDSELTYHQQNAYIADYILCVARTEDGKAPEEGLTLFLADPDCAGIMCTLLKTIAGDKQCEVVCEDIRVPRENIIGEPGKGWSAI